MTHHYFIIQRIHPKEITTASEFYRVLEEEITGRVRRIQKVITYTMEQE